MKFVRKYTIMLVPFNQEKVIRFSVTNFSLYTVSAILFLIVFLAGLSLFSDSNIFTLHERQNHNRQIRETISVFQSSLRKNHRYYLDTRQDLESLLLSYYPVFNQRYALEEEITSQEQILFLQKMLNQYARFYQGINQFFRQIPSIFPVVGGGQITSRFGARVDPFTMTVGYHTGVDIPKFPGTPIRAAGAGKVAAARFSSSYGFVVQIEHGYGYYTTYAHMLSMPLVKVDEPVEQGQIIGYVGSTGRSVGYHLHYEVRHLEKLLDPEDFLFLKQ